jgi:hypothetical protein
MDIRPLLVIIRRLAQDGLGKESTAFIYFTVKSPYGDWAFFSLEFTNRLA